MDLFTIVQLFQSLWVLYIVVMLFVKFRNGVAAYLAYIFLVPYMKLSIGGFVLQWNLINIIVLIAFFVHQRKQGIKLSKYDWRPLLPFIIYFSTSFFLMPFQGDVPLNYAFDSWRMQVMKFLILPFVIWNDILVDKESLRLYRKITVACIVIAALYGLFLTAIPGINPYMMVVSAVNGTEFNLAYAAGYSGTTDYDAFEEGDEIEFKNNITLNDERLFGRISSVFSHPMTFGLFLGFALLYLYRNREHISKKLLYVMTFVILTDVMVCGVRTVIVALFAVIIFLLIKLRKTKYIFIFAITGTILWSIIANSPWLSNYLGSIIDENSFKIGGSSMEMRISQLNGCFHEIQNSFLTGKGFGWTGYFLSQHESHPTMLYFESLIIVILCNSGIIGLFLWIYMSAKIIKFNNLYERTTAILLLSLLLFYLTYACITGDYGYMQYFILFYVLMCGEGLISKRTKGTS